MVMVTQTISMTTVILMVTKLRDATYFATGFNR
jgi:hypothetical protein